eukprot:1486731-Amphidinium_carterae.3
MGRDPSLLLSNHSALFVGRSGSNTKPLTFCRPEDNHIDHLIMDSPHTSSVTTLLRGDDSAAVICSSTPSREKPHAGVCVSHQQDSAPTSDPDVPILSAGGPVTAAGGWLGGDVGITALFPASEHAARN